MQQWFSCPRCGKANSTGQQFCIGCGQIFQYRCPHCGTNVDVAITCCPKCGYVFQSRSLDSKGTSTNKVRNKSILLWLVVGILSAVIIIGASYWAISSKKSFNVDNIAYDTLNEFLAYAINADTDNMWAMIHSDSVSEYNDLNNFKWMNGISCDNYGLSLLTAYDIKTAKMLASWNKYLNVLEAQVNLSYKKNTLVTLSELIMDIRLVPDRHEKIWYAHLVKVDNNWKIICDSSNPLKGLGIK